jgi:hypothetical protein
MNRRGVIGLAILGAMAWSAWQWMFPSDEAQIRAGLDRIAAAMTNTSS